MNTAKYAFNSCRDYLNFTFAKEFLYANDPEQKFPVSKVEALAHKALRPLQYPIDKVLKNIKEPGYIAAICVTLLGVNTMLWYPDKTLEALQAVCSPVFDLETWMLKFGAFLTSETVITALMVRTMARLHDTALVQAWKDHQVFHVHMGTKVIRAQQG